MDMKSCEICSTLFERPADYSRVQWVSRKFCSSECSEEKKRRVRKAKHRCKSCGGSGPFHSYITASGRLSQRSKCKRCWNEARKPKRKTPDVRAKENGYSKTYRDRIRASDPARLTLSKAWAVLNPEKYLFYRMRANSAKKRGRIARLITFAEFMTEIGGGVPTVCPILGIPMSLKFGRKADGLPTIDRLDSSKSYEVGNIAVISWRANIIKNMGTADEHRKIAEWMDRHDGGPSS